MCNFHSITQTTEPSSVQPGDVNHMHSLVMLNSINNAVFQVVGLLEGCWSENTLAVNFSVIASSSRSVSIDNLFKKNHSE